MKTGSEPKSWSEDLQRLQSLEYIPAAHIDFFKHICEAHYRARDRLIAAGEQIYPPLSRQRAQEMLSEGFPILNFDRLKIEEEPLREHFKEISPLLDQYGPNGENGQDGQAKLRSAQGKLEEYRNLKELIRKTLFDGPLYPKKLSEQCLEQQSGDSLLALSLARPFFELAAAELKNMLADYPWWRGYCPACGSVPLMARIRKEDGMRLLRCSLCATEWKFARVKCPFCNTEEQKNLKFFYYHEQSPHRLYVCDQCGRYIKCIDERKTDQQIDLSIEDMATLYLDVLALEKGYRK